MGGVSPERIGEGGYQDVGRRCLLACDRCRPGNIRQSIQNSLGKLPYYREPELGSLQLVP